MATAKYDVDLNSKEMDLTSLCQTYVFGVYTSCTLPLCVCGQGWASWSSSSTYSGSGWEGFVLQGFPALLTFGLLVEPLRKHCKIQEETWDRLVSERETCLPAAGRLPYWSVWPVKCIGAMSSQPLAWHPFCRTWNGASTSMPPCTAFNQQPW